MTCQGISTPWQGFLVESFHSVGSNRALNSFDGNNKIVSPVGILFLQEKLNLSTKPVN
jgi:hypothetical protein